MIVLGVDPHKYSHTIVAVDSTTGQVVDDVQVAARKNVGNILVDWAARYEDRVWAVEDVRQLSGRLQVELLGLDERVVRVPPKLMAGVRRSARTLGKSDPIDAEAVARAAIRHPDLPGATFDPALRDVKLLCNYRDQLVGERTRMHNRLRWLLHELDPDWQIALRTLERAITMRKVEVRLRQYPQTAQVDICNAILQRCMQITKEIDQLLTRLDHATWELAPTLRKMVGCGALTAARIIADAPTGIPSDAKLAMLAGVAPLQASSGDHQRHRLNRMGNRRLNGAIHRIALTQIRMHPPAKAYMERRQEDGKTRREAMRALKRYVTRAVHKALIADAGHRLA